MNPDVPDNVASAALRLRELEQPRPALHRPQVFLDIIANHSAQAAIRAKGTDMTQDEWRRLGLLREDFRKNLRPSAERALCWNTDKGDGCPKA